MTNQPNMPRVCIGIVHWGNDERLQRTCKTLFANTAFPFKTRILATPFCETLPDEAVPVTDSCAGALNALIAEGKFDFYILLEAGVEPAPRALEKLIHGLEQRPDCGIAGPSTNDAWNEQAVFHKETKPRELKRIAKLAQSKFGKTSQTLDPLHCIAPFCYVVSRSVVDTIGYADEAFGDGPCWEMAYNVRATRAGFMGLWVKAAYVYRPPQDVPQQLGLENLFEINKRLYQDHFCGLRQIEPKRPYAKHCNGDTCVHFATQRPQRIEDRCTHKVTMHPLVSCIMPTKNRAPFVAHAIAYFTAQTYPEKELIILYETSADLPADMPQDDRIKKVRVPAETSIGKKRNIGVLHSCGAIIAQWDDDDPYARDRLEQQIQPIVQGEAHITAIGHHTFLDVANWVFWSCSSELYHHMFAHGVAGGSLVYLRQYWLKAGGYIDASMREDANLLEAMMESGATLSPIASRDLFAYARHPHNTWNFQLGKYVGPSHWKQIDPPGWCAPLRQRYQPDAIPRVEFNIGFPKVSCLMPSADRPKYIERAILCFLAQDYPNKELLILDNSRTAYRDIPSHPHVHYHRVTENAPLGSLRNTACSLASGEVMMHWDDDDLMAPTWITRQVETLYDHNADICGLAALYFVDAENRRAWFYHYPDNLKAWVAGGTLCYRKAFWQTHPFPEIQIGEDTQFVWQNHAAKIARHTFHKGYFATIHSKNTSPKMIDDVWWTPVPFKDIEALIAKQWQKPAEEILLIPSSVAAL